MTALSRRKGVRGEQELSRIYRAHGFDVRRTPNSGGLHAKGDNVGVPGVHIESKRYKGRAQLGTWLQQTITEADPLNIPALHHRRDFDVWFVTVPTSDFRDLQAAAGWTPLDYAYLRRHNGYVTVALEDDFIGLLKAKEA